MIHKEAYERYRGEPEIDVLLGIVLQAGCRNVLEVGSRYGRMLLKLGEIMPKGSYISSIELPRGQGDRPDSIDSLNSVMEKLRADSFDAELFEGNSQDQLSIAWAKSRGPFDLVFIDGDHKYDAAETDWKNYRGMTKIIAFHDIAKGGPQGHMHKFFSKARSNHRSIVCLCGANIYGSDKGAPGLGIIWMNE